MCLGDRALLNISKPISQVKAANTASTTRTARSSASPRKTSSTSQASRSRKKQFLTPGPEVVEVDSDSPLPDRKDSGLATPLSSRPASTAQNDGSAKKLPAHHLRTAKPLVMHVDDAVNTASGGSLSVKSRLSRQFASTADDNLAVSGSGQNSEASTSGRPKIAATRAGPGRSSKGMVTGSTSLLTGMKGGLRTIQQRRESPVKSDQHRKASVDVGSRSASADAMVVDEPRSSSLLDPLSTEDMNRLTMLTQSPAAPAAPVAGDLPDYEEVTEATDRDAEGEIDYETQEPNLLQLEIVAGATDQTTEITEQAATNDIEQSGTSKE
jgi:hypothetical protein